MYKKIMIAFLILMVQKADAQNEGYFKKASPYELTLKKDIPLTLGAGVLYRLGVSTLNNESRPNFVIGQFSQEDIAGINFLDRGAAKNWNPNAKGMGKPFLNVASLGVPIGLLALPGKVSSRASLMLMFYEGYYITGGLVTLSKGLTNRYRPFTYLNQQEVDNLSDEFRLEYLEDIKGGDIEDSFFSGDAAKTGYGFVFFAKAFNDYFPESKLKTIIWTTSLLAIGGQGYFRVKSGKHFPSDVILGSIIGGGMGYLIPHLHKKGSKISFAPSNNGLSFFYNIE